MKMRLTIIGLFCLGICRAQEFSLAPPQIHCSSDFFEKNTQISLDFALEGAQIQYSLDQGVHWKLYRKPILCKKSTLIQAKTLHPDYQTSAIVEKAVLRKGLPFGFLSPLKQAPAAPYTGKEKPERMLVDGLAGSTNLNDGRWLGFRSNMELEGGWIKGRKVKAAYISTCISRGSWIFPPASITVFGANGGGSFQEIGKLALRDQRANNGKQVFRVALKPGKWQKIRISVEAWGPLPDDHPGKGNPAWLFLDEILLD